MHTYIHSIHTYIRLEGRAVLRLLLTDTDTFIGVMCMDAFTVDLGLDGFEGESIYMCVCVCVCVCVCLRERDREQKRVYEYMWCMSMYECMSDTVCECLLYEYMSI